LRLRKWREVFATDDPVSPAMTSTLRSPWASESMTSTSLGAQSGLAVTSFRATRHA
jgi:hypothetical protein